MDTVLGLIGMLVLAAMPLGYAIVQFRLLRRWTGPWRIAAGAPLIGWAIWVGGFARDIAADPTSHNLFPFEVLMGAAAALLYLGVLAAARRFAGKG